MADQDVDGHEGAWLVNVSGPTLGTPTRITEETTNTALDVFTVVWSPASDAVALRGDLIVHAQDQLFVSFIENGVPQTAVLSSTPTPTPGTDVLTPIFWRGDGGAVFYRSDEIVDNNFELWYLPLAGRTIHPRERWHPPVPSGGDVLWFYKR